MCLGSGMEVEPQETVIGKTYFRPIIKLWLHSFQHLDPHPLKSINSCSTEGIAMSILFCNH
jgi:hypothetical protein